MPCEHNLADWVVRELGKPFRDAHHISGSIVEMAEKRDIPLAQLSLDEMQSVEPGIDERVFSVLSARASMESRTSFGGTSPVRVREQVAAWKARLG